MIVFFCLSALFCTSFSQSAFSSSFASANSGGSLLSNFQSDLFGSFSNGFDNNPFGSFSNGFDNNPTEVPEAPAGPTPCQSLQANNLPRFSLSQSDFASGTKIIDSAGVYTLSSDIIFNPNSAADLEVDYYSAGDVQPEQYAFYDPKAYGIGFFAAIAITTDDVLIDLNGFSIVQSEEHALAQRFYTHIELASSPFVQGQGPHDFGNLQSANNVCIKNGVLGRSSHGGIHGNGNSDIEIRDLTIKDYETAGIQLNKGINVLIENIEMPNAREDVPVACRFSAARFIRPWINKLASSGYTGSLKVGDKFLSASQIQQELRDAINSASAQVLSSGGVAGDLAYLFGNPGGLPDGSTLYGVIINQLGVAVNGLPSDVSQNKRSKDVIIRDVNIGNIKLDVKELPVLSTDGETPSSDAVGAIVQILDGTTVQQEIYQGNPIANAQLLVAKAIHEGFNFGFLSTGKNKISPEIVAWAESGQSYSSQNLQFICNSDLMFHVLKGPIGFEFGGANDLTCQKCSVNHIQNFGKIGSEVCNDNLRYRTAIGVSNPLATQTGFHGGDARAFSISSSSNVQLKQCSAGSVLANAGDAYGVDVMFGSSDVEISGFSVGNIQGGTGYSLISYAGNPTGIPRAKDINKDISSRGVQIQ
eukprot:TRINITY_DN3625_c0_g1_i10.p1 TRINITY_DN3625_c0_g1~~TRINITY_DN3625_c0_g1_i10.p1  ORF type:complete len:706 (+),score=114.90 TRINITY_DN3625_c0_g1_i10:187-2118(+)